MPPPLIHRLQTPEIRCSYPEAELVGPAEVRLMTGFTGRSFVPTQ